MRIIEQRLLRGPNLFAATPCLLAVVDSAGAELLPGLGARLLALLPEMPREGSARLSDCNSALDALELGILGTLRDLVVMELKGQPAGDGHA